MPKSYLQVAKMNSCPINNKVTDPFEFIDFSESIRFFLRFWKFENFER